DVFGDWREEMRVRPADSSAGRVYLRTEGTDRQLYTPMHDPQYRAEGAQLQTTYNEPSYTNFHPSSYPDGAQVQLPHCWTPGRIGALRDLLASYVESGELSGPVVPQLTNALRQAEHQLEKERFDHAVRDLERFLKHLEKAKRPSHVSDAAKA